MPKEFVKKYIDLLALHKMNRFHWHLTDDQGWRIEIKKYPRLTQVGAWRDSTIVGRMVRDTTKATWDKKRHGGFYTQDDVREVVAYAAERFVTIVPEIEMPGHSQATVAAYPYLGNFGDTIKPWTCGASPTTSNPSDTTIAFMEDVLTEVMALFPGPYIHTGGDEAPKKQWKASPRAQNKMKELGIFDPNEPPNVYKAEDKLQAWFTTQIDAFLTKRGRRLVGWDEILEGGLAPGAMVMSWRGTQGGIDAARAGHDVVMTPGSHTYLDHYQASRETEPLAIGGFFRSTPCIRTSLSRRSSSPSSQSTSSARRANCGPNTWKGRRPSNTWRSLVPPRLPKCCGRRATSATSPTSSLGSLNISSA